MRVGIVIPFLPFISRASPCLSRVPFRLPTNILFNKDFLLFNKRREKQIKNFSFCTFNKGVLCQVFKRHLFVSVH